MLWRCFLLASLCAPLSAAEYPHWRGTTRNGLVSESSGWTDKTWDLKEVWKANVGEGNGSAIVFGKVAYFIGYQGKQDHLTALDLSTGKSLWKQSYDSPKYGRHARGDQNFFSGPSSTPEFDAKTGYLFTLSCDGDFRCWDTKAQGKLIWKIALHDKYDIPVRPQVPRSAHRDYGFTSSPLVQDKVVIVEVGAKQGTLIAFDIQTGKEVWKSQAKDPAGHNGGPVPMTIESKPCVAVLHHFGLLVVRTDATHEGETIATWPWETAFSNNIASPTVVDNQILITSDYNMKKMARLSISLKGAKKVWEVPHSSKVCSPVVKNGHVYWVWTKMNCLDWETGKLVWQKAGYTNQGSCLMTSDDRLVIFTGRGDLALIENAQRSPKECRVLAKIPTLFEKDAWPHIVLANGHYLCRDRDGNVVCLRIGK